MCNIQRNISRKSNILFIPDKRSFNSNLDDVYVMVTMVSDEKVLSRHQTDFHKHFECTIVNERLSIPLKKNELERSALIVTVHCRIPESDFKFEVGRCCIGSITYTSGQTLTHWNDVILYWGIDITRTHSLF